ncbi:MAG: AAA family ATPase [Gammaproteobacteria bacterium]|nr:AAA family ATPase [Gammaproteobacteria bacterium]MBT8443684.1 AAA family ATPase [Gammaproteobacteria bacterium]
MNRYNEIDAEIAPKVNNLPPLIRNLLRAEAFPDCSDPPKLIETHISWVILAGDCAYKIKKPVDLGFLDFSTLELRRHFCAEELRLNRHFAPTLYLDVVPLGGSAEDPEIGAEPAIEWAVRMRRFDEDAVLDHLAAAGRLRGDDLRGFGATLAGDHDRAATSTHPDYGTLESISKPAFDNFDSLRRDCASEADIVEQLERLRRWTAAETVALRQAFEMRVVKERIRECHGDLHLGNIVKLGATCVAFDCLEFDPALRWIDVSSDVGFLVMDLLHTERADLACEFLNRYLEVSGDCDCLTTLTYYMVYRAMVRAKTTAVGILQHAGERNFAPVRDYLQLAVRLTRPPRSQRLVICHGLSGSGKTWLSNRLIGRLPAIRLRSDVIRKQLYGLEELDRSSAGLNAGIYAAEASRRTYERMAQCATLCLQAGFNVIADATFLRRADRAAFEAVATKTGAELTLLHCEADRTVLEARVRNRQRDNRDASEADSAVLHQQIAAREPLVPEELGRTISVRTDRDIDLDALLRSLRPAIMQ